MSDKKFYKQRKTFSSRKICIMSPMRCKMRNKANADAIERETNIILPKANDAAMMKEMGW